jgi:predicted dehydrogenase
MQAIGKQDHRGGGEDMMVLGTHLFNMMRFFCGDPIWMTARVMVGDREIIPDDIREANEPIGRIAGDNIVSLFSFSNGVDGAFVSRTNQAGKGQGYGLVLVGESGRIAINGGGDQITIHDDGIWAPWAGDHAWTSLGLAAEPLQEAGNRQAILNLIDSMENDREPISSVRDARWALEMILGAYASQISQARVIFPIGTRSHPLEDWGV